jgi:microcystin-dependent protein
MLSNTRLTSTALAATLSLLAGSSYATCTADPMIGSICITAANFCPRDYAEAAGQTMLISQNTALFSLLGTTYGGNGQTTFNLPDLRGRTPVGTGQGPGLSNVFDGQTGGAENVNLTVAQMPAHTHAAQLKGTAATGNTDSPAGAVPARMPRANDYSTGAADANMGASAISVSPTGSGQPVDVRNPYLGLHYCIALTGIFPSRP